MLRNSNTESLTKAKPRKIGDLFLVREHRIKQMIWLYYILVIFEGALRKWILPGLATPLLLVRDPIAIYLIYYTIKCGLFPKSFYIISMSIFTILSIFTALLFGHGNILVALYGARLFLLHFPVIFIMGKIFNRNDVIKLGEMTLWFAILIAAVVALQFFSPQNSWINQSIGGAEGEGFGGALGFSRPTGVFSFNNGNSFFFNFAACFIFYFWLSNEKDVNRGLLLAASICLLIVIPLSISRYLLFSVVLVFLFALVAVARKPKYLTNMVGGLLGVLFLVAILSYTPAFNTAIEVFTARFTNANEAEGGLQGVLVDRYLGGMVGALTKETKIPFWGLGIGTGTNVGSQLLTGGGSVFLLPEGEWGRLMGEMGIVLGLGVIIVRLKFAADLAVGAYKRMIKGDLLAWMLLSFGLLLIPQGTWGQPTPLGFAIVIGGLIMASFNKPPKQVA